MQYHSSAARENADEHSCRRKRKAATIGGIGSDTVEESWEGEFVHGELHGTGKWYNRMNLRCYDGEWKVGKRNGQGKMTYLGDGRTFEGTWVDNKRQGEGRLSFNSDAVVFEGEWSDDTFDFTDGRKLVMLEGCKPQSKEVKAYIEFSCVEQMMVALVNAKRGNRG